MQIGANSYILQTADWRSPPESNRSGEKSASTPTSPEKQKSTPNQSIQGYTSEEQKQRSPCRKKHSGVRSTHKDLEKKKPRRCGREECIQLAPNTEEVWKKKRSCSHEPKKKSCNRKLEVAIKPRRRNDPKKPNKKRVRRTHKRLRSSMRYRRSQHEGVEEDRREDRNISQHKLIGEARRNQLRPLGKQTFAGDDRSRTKPVKKDCGTQR